MERIVIFLRTVKKKGDIRLRFRLTDGRRTDIYHKSRIKASLADLSKFNLDGTLRPKISVYNKQLAQEIAAEITAMRNAYRYLLGAGMILNSANFEAQVAAELYPEIAVRPRGDSLLSVFREAIESGHEEGLYGMSRYAHYKSLFHQLERFLKINGIESITAMEFNDRLLMGFRAFLFDEYQYVDGPLYKHLKRQEIPVRRRASNTVAGDMRMLRSFFNELEDREEIGKSPFRKLGKERRKNIIQTKYDDPIFLQRDEFQKIMNFSAPYDLEETKEAFLVQCALGCRVSDFRRLTINNIGVTPEGIPYIHYLPVKTLKSQMDRREIETPLLRFAFDIIRRRGFRFSVLGKGCYNKRIRKLLALGGIDRTVAVFNEGKNENEYVPLYVQGSSKLCRKTHVDMLSKVQVDFYVSGLHKRGSDAVNRYTKLELKDRFALMNAAFEQEAYRVDKELNVLA